MFKLKPLSKTGVPAALERAKTYRLLNEPRLAESICLDILEVEPESQEAIVMLLLSITDQFSRDTSTDEKKARELLPGLKSEYERHYYAGIICERQGKAIISRQVPGGKYMAYEWFQDAMEHFEKAESMRPSGNDDAILRWNTCVRLIERYKLEPRQEDTHHPFLE